MAFNDKEQGGSAFPCHGSMGEVAEPGMTLRDYFAAKAITTLVNFTNDKNYELEAARVAYIYADAMIAERNR